MPKAQRVPADYPEWDRHTHVRRSCHVSGSSVRPRHPGEDERGQNAIRGADGPNGGPKRSLWFSYADRDRAVLKGVLECRRRHPNLLHADYDSGCRNGPSPVNMGNSGAEGSRWSGRWSGLPGRSDAPGPKWPADVDRHRLSTQPEAVNAARLRRSRPRVGDHSSADATMSSLSATSASRLPVTSGTAPLNARAATEPRHSRRGS